MTVDTACSGAPLKEHQRDHSPTTRRFAQFAVGLSISVSVLVFLGFATELVSIAILSLPQKDAYAGSHHSYYKDKPWSAEYWRESELAERQQYRPFVVWK